MDNVVVRGESKSPSMPLDKYQRHTGAFDEFLADGGMPRPQYNKLFTELEEFSVPEMRRHRETCDRLVHEQGITCNVYGDPRGIERPWQLDPIPLVLPPDEWRSLEAGLVQRATLLNKVSVDVEEV